VTFEATTDLASVMECNCSHCSKKGFLLTFVPADAFTLNGGEDALTEYRFNKKHIQHLFCATCGVQSFGRGRGPDGTEMVAVNVRCLDGVDPKSLAITPVDGASA
jgi:hypothetical protein